ncbi:YihY/virulence factor BrkB family protein [Goodfellowiella coeruleoviolacea]|uniref:Membrane protein n=1 Tax=Goodfellowiella coeruleoviolacea TaxID=334858 RepID=A0AAE3GJ96_9PSEU|nr:YihY/virulence factor BrkB family protein [Goodfellowiella coeruleoviolacea]MCP2168339.1 membrane protein [Goodfellowiella coeruleoviolacea]
MDPQSGHTTARSSHPSGEPPVRRGALRLFARTLAKAWEGNIFSEAAEAAFWQTMSLPPLLLGLLGSLGFLGDWFGPDVVHQVQGKILSFSQTIFNRDVVERIIAPTVADILTKGRSEIVSLGFLLSLWAGSSAMSSFVDAITVAHGQYGVRHDVWQRIFALLLYVAFLVLAIVGLPVLAIGPDLLPNFFPVAWQPTITEWVSLLYYPVVAVLLVLALATLYKLALPRKLPWHRGLPGAVLAMVVFILSSIGLRLYIGWITTTGYTYGALATPIAFLLFAFFIGLAIVSGAYFNSAIQEMYPAKMTRRQRRRWRRLEMERAAERLRAEEGRRAWRARRPADQPGDQPLLDDQPPDDQPPHGQSPDVQPPDGPSGPWAEQPGRGANGRPPTADRARRPEYGRPPSSDESNRTDTD